MKNMVININKFGYKHAYKREIFACSISQAVVMI